VEASVSASVGGFSGGASAAHNESKTSGSESSNASSSHASESVSKGGLRQFGQIAASGKCGDLLGQDNILFPVEYEIEPIYNLAHPGSSPGREGFCKACSPS